MQDAKRRTELPPIPNKRYFGISEAARLCAVKPHVLRYWEQEFPQLQLVQRRGNRRFYQEKDILFLRQIRRLLYELGYTILGARNWLRRGKQLASPTKNSPVVREVILELEETLALLK
ncbi:MAG: MerR family transcriptional regulator [Gammaproteobacteria bacterium]|nr:MerR family transcriptional regulator [Gammaproteobacteria bacterium]